MKISPSLVARVGLLLTLNLLCLTSVSGQANGFAPPAGLKKYPFWPQAGNFWDDLFPTNFVDLDPTTGILDYHGTNYTYDGHLGTDTAIGSFAYMAIGVPIFAALDGTVLETHDGEFDMSTQLTDKPVNYVLIDHGGGQQTLYLHMKKGSVAVKVGEHVVAGQQIGLTGSSGYSAGPHLHFESHYNGSVFEPFAGTSRPGIGNWVYQPPFKSSFYLRLFVVTSDDLTKWAGWPYDTTRTGTFQVGTRAVNFWSYMHNVRADSNARVRYLRPDDSVALDSGTAPIADSVGSFQRSLIEIYDYNPKLNVTGAWHIEYSINGQVIARAPFTVIASGAPVMNRPPLPVTAILDPPTATPNDVLFCRITSSKLFDDPDYNIVRYHYLWQVAGVTVRDVITAGRADAIPHNLGRAGETVTCTVTPSDGSVTAPTITVSTELVPARPTILVNLSTRGVVTGSQDLIGGFIIGGPGPKQVMLRAIGPSLNVGGVPLAGRLMDPVLELHDASGALIQANDNWADNQPDLVIASGLTPNDSHESAIVTSLAPGDYTAVVRSADGGSGLALVELYDLATTQPSKPLNISTRGFVGTGDNVLISGIIIGGASNARVLLRGLGPSLGKLHIAHPLEDPVLEVRNAEGTVTASNDDWQDSQAAAIKATGAAPTNPREAAILATLSVGPHTILLSGKNSGTGIGLVETYSLP